MSTSETITRTDLTNILNEVLPSTHGIGISKGSWTSSGTSAYNVKVTSDLTLSKGLYLVTIHTPYVASGIGYVGLRINDVADNSCVVVAPTNEYARGAFLVDLSAQSTVAGYSEGSQAVTYSVLERGGIEAVQLVRYTESLETDPVFTASDAYGITSSDIDNWDDKQDELVSGTNIKTINNTSLLGSGDISLPNIFVSTSDPTSADGNNGDVWFKYSV